MPFIIIPILFIVLIHINNITISVGGSYQNANLNEIAFQLTFLFLMHFLLCFLETRDYVHGAAGANLHLVNNNNIVEKKDIQFRTSFESNIHHGSYPPHSTEETSSHLLDHNYAASSFDECFGESWKGKLSKIFFPWN